MADSASDPKVEDVLSSVRRLVSGEIPRKRTEPAKGPGALVLTDADRIEKDPLVRVAARSLEDRIAELEAAVDSGSEEFEPDGSEDQSQHRPDRIVYTRPPRSEEEAQLRRSTLRLSEIALIETGPANEEHSDGEVSAEFRHGPASRPGPETTDPASETPSPEAAASGGGVQSDADASGIDDTAASEAASEAPMAEDVPTEPPRRADIRVFSNPDDVVARLEARLIRGDGEESDAIGRVPDSDGSEEPTGENFLRAEEESTGAGTDFDTALAEAVEASLDPVDAFDIADTLAADAGAVESADQSDWVEKVASLPVTDEDEPEPAVAEPAAAEQSVPEPEPATVEETAEATLPDNSPDNSPEQAAAALSALSDEEAMRLLVGRLIREELQGALGERITQNVRKLVRREIKRALEARDLV